MKLSLLAVMMGTGLAVPQVLGLLKPQVFADMARRFPRHENAGRVLMVTATAWFLWNLRAESISDFAAFKPYMYAGFAALGIGSCFFVRDFLAVRGLAILFMLLAKLMVDTARFHPSDWRLVMAVWAYVLAVAGMWFTVSPWRMRDFIGWWTATEARVRMGSAVRLAFAVGVLVLGVVVY